MWWCNRISNRTGASTNIKHTDYLTTNSSPKLIHNNSNTKIILQQIPAHILNHNHSSTKIISQQIQAHELIHNNLKIQIISQQTYKLARNKFKHTLIHNNSNKRNTKI